VESFSYKSSLKYYNRISIMENPEENKKYCEVCGLKYHPIIKICPECDSDLIPWNENYTINEDFDKDTGPCPQCQGRGIVFTGTGAYISEHQSILIGGNCTYCYGSGRGKVI
jgi:hypothetical protein